MSDDLTVPRPDLVAVRTYLTAAKVEPTEASDDTVGRALLAERAAQARCCRIPADGDPWPADLAAALCRRVHVHLKMLTKPLALEASVSQAGVGFARIGGKDPEVIRLERPFRRRPVAG